MAMKRIAAMLLTLVHMNENTVRSKESRALKKMGEWLQ